MALGDKPRREAARLGHAGKPEPFVEPLPQRNALPYVNPVFLNKYIHSKRDFKAIKPTLV